MLKSEAEHLTLGDLNSSEFKHLFELRVAGIVVQNQVFTFSLQLQLQRGEQRYFMRGATGSLSLPKKDKKDRETPILVTGCAGLIGAAVCAAFREEGIPVCGLDIRSSNSEELGDVTQQSDIAAAMANCVGIIHLAAISRIQEAEDDPQQAFNTNVTGTRLVLEGALTSSTKPWVIVASSREVYGDACGAPLDESAPHAPTNTYARTKVEVERLVEASRQRGLRAAIIRPSNVYGAVNDHENRVVPAFVQAALDQRVLRVQGRDQAFDFTHVSDVARALLLVAARLQAGFEVPAMHFVSGVSTRLLALAELVVECANSTSPIQIEAPRGLGAARFVGDPSRAQRVLGWSAQIPLRRGISELIAVHQAQGEMK
ncbi:NAD(P)-dependent oxidoreductase [Myxococcota bacterium]|nr:NAD(P)-dependent oxidoreductase [Myxococcota bacterium]MBU1898856.1 NAD(P)-dependent oxidoreductase [Myxococcota bacterium]